MNPSAPPRDTSWTLWTGTIGYETPFLDRITIATATGADRIVVSPLDLEVLEHTGGRIDGWAAAAADAGLGVTMDPVVGWHPHGPTRAFARVLQPIGTTLRRAGELGCDLVTAVATETATADDDGMTEAFADLTARAADHGIQVQLEFVPMTAVPDASAAWRIVAATGRGGLVVDSWHVFHGPPQLDVLARIPGDRIFSVQLADAETIDRSRPSWRHTFDRCAPGSGVLPLSDLVDVLQGSGALRHVGAEVIRPHGTITDPLAAATAADRATRALLATA